MISCGFDERARTELPDELLVRIDAVREEDGDARPFRLLGAQRRDGEEGLQHVARPERDVEEQRVEDHILPRLQVDEHRRLEQDQRRLVRNLDRKDGVHGADFRQARVLAARPWQELEQLGRQRPRGNDDGRPHFWLVFGHLPVEQRLLVPTHIRKDQPQAEH